MRRTDVRPARDARKGGGAARRGRAAADRRSGLRRFGPPALLLAGLAALGLSRLSGGTAGSAPAGAAPDAPAVVAAAAPADPAAAVEGRVTRALGKILQGSDADRGRALDAIRELGADGIEELRTVHDGRDDPSRFAAAYALALLGDDGDRLAVAEHFSSLGDDAPLLLAMAAAELENPHLADQFRDLMASSDPRARAAAARALRGATPPAYEELFALAADGDAQVRAVAEASLQRTLEVSSPDGARPAVELVLRGAEPLRRLAAIRLCGRLSADWAVAAVEAAARDTDAAAREEAVFVLASVRNPGAEAALTRLLREPRERGDRILAAQALSSAKPRPEVVEALAAAAGGDDALVALAAAQSLAAHRDARAIPVLVALQEVEVSAAARVDDGDRHVLRGRSAALLEHLAAEAPRRRGEPWKTWWARVGEAYRFPARAPASAPA